MFYGSSLASYLQQSDFNGLNIFWTMHYENMPIQIHWKFYNQKKEKISDKKILIFFTFLLKT